MTSVSVADHRGWGLVLLESEVAAVEIVSGKGGDILRFRSLDPDVEVLWSGLWGLRHRGADEVDAYGRIWWMHGEVWTTPFDVTPLDDGAEFVARLKRVPHAFPHAWLWTQCRASPGFPVQRRDRIAERTGLWRLDAGEEQATMISLEVQEQH